MPLDDVSTSSWGERKRTPFDTTRYAKGLIVLVAVSSCADQNLDDRQVVVSCQKGSFSVSVKFGGNHLALAALRARVASGAMCDRVSHDTWMISKTRAEFGQYITRSLCGNKEAGPEFH